MKKTRKNSKYQIGLVIVGLSLLLNSCGENQTPTGQNSGNTNDTSITNQNSRLATIKQRGKLICGVNGQLPGFSFVNEQGEYTGLDVDICRAIAAALFDDPTKVEYRALSTQERFTAVQSGEVDILSRNTTYTLSRDTSVGLEFAPITFYDGQGMMVSKASGIKTLEDLKGKTICVQAGTTTELNLSDQMRKRGIDYTPVVFDDPDAMYAAYQQGRCQAATSDRSQLSSRRSALPKPDDHIVLDTVLSKEPLAVAVANGDSAWFDVVKWSIYALMEAEELGITAKNISTFANSQDPSVKRFLGAEGELGADMGLSNDFAARIVKHVGNYEEIYDRNITKTIGLQRGLNQLWTKGGLLYSPPFR
ncbi:amino acid ABC transporter substrate-binding protein [Aphanothece hegewaldii CCALA 016]|uniref:Amino acid ABC transporter substrate-binding protein n=1 Tax=Aphanothece hegewaldii CCALA 016 TaxID=2107694 RepID=A0A2T1M222_9CHRO|nr:amino acid ABC transporter substrate-binding protein [Aphanothece hegewaldii]PSF38751.1 amino acid ABC transporter substrate-binding protein [Aphanothece hegewaldii CCALA 016]